MVGQPLLAHQDINKKELNIFKNHTHCHVPIILVLVETFLILVTKNIRVIVLLLTFMDASHIHDPHADR